MEELKKDAGDTNSKVPATSTDTEVKANKKKKKGLLSRIWNAIFRSGRDDFEKRLQHISKEEAAVIERITRRSQSWRRISRHLIILSVLFEVIAVVYAIMTTRSLHLNWKMRALRVLPMFLLPGLSFITYSALGSFTRICDNKDQRTLERLRAERKAKIDELKEKTNYYITQQLIQRYDTDPTAKAAAATVLASKLGADTGLKVYVGDETQQNAPVGKSSDVEVVQSSGLRNRKQVTTRSVSSGSTVVDNPEEKMLHQTPLEGSDMSQHHPLVVEHHNPTGPNSQNGGWVSRIAALLVGEDPKQSYALICGNCRMHNGLARKEDYPYITYFCPHCNALNTHKHSQDHASGPNTSDLSSSLVPDAAVIKNASAPVAEKISASSCTPGCLVTETDKVSSNVSTS